MVTNCSARAASPLKCARTEVVRKVAKTNSTCLATRLLALTSKSASSSTRWHSLSIEKENFGSSEAELEFRTTHCSHETSAATCSSGRRRRPSTEWSRLTFSCQTRPRLRSLACNIRIELSLSTLRSSASQVTHQKSGILPLRMEDLDSISSRY